MSSADLIPHCPHISTGYVCWPPAGPVAGQPHASRVTCDLPQCIALTSTWIEATTGHPGAYQPWPAPDRPGALPSNPLPHKGETPMATCVDCARAPRDKQCKRHATIDRQTRDLRIRSHEDRCGHCRRHPRSCPEREALILESYR